MSLSSFLRGLLPSSDRSASAAEERGLPPFLQALSPSSYRDRVHQLEDGVIRLFGTHWGCGAIALKQEAVAGTNRFALSLAKLSAREEKSPVTKFHQNQTVFDSDLYRSLADHRFDYPFFGEKPAVASDLLVEEIAIKGRVEGRLFQLLQGRIEILDYRDPDERAKLLEDLRKNSGLLEPNAGSDEKPFRSIYLYPDGFCIHAAIRTPWMAAGEKLDGWFNVTTRGAPAAAPGTQDIRPGLVLCFDADLPGNERHLADWTKAADALRRALAAAGAGTTQWFSLTDAGGIAPRDFFWPARYKASRDDHKGIFFTRDPSDTSLSVSRSVRARLAPGRTGEQRLSAMEIACEEIAIAQVPGGFRVTGGAPVDRPEVEYTFPDEQLRFGRAGSDPAAPRRRQLDLAVPLIETARTIRALSGMPERDDPIGEDIVGPLWTFTPIEDGFLHWPLPDATLERIESLLQAERLADPAPAPQKDLGASVVTGGMVLANDASLAGFASGHRGWQLAVTGGVNGWFEADIHRAANDTWTLARAGAKLGECRFVAEGLVPLVPFRQTPERLLPNQDERALGAASLEAVSPGLLRGLEERMWHRAQNPNAKCKVQLKLRLVDFAIAAPTAPGGAAGMAGEVEFHSTIASRKGGAVDPSLRPWLWRRFGQELPASQTHALALAGESRRDFSNSRELYPAALADPSTTIAYRLTGALDMARPAPGLRIDGWKLESPLGGSKKRQWFDEPGLAVLTMPSLTVFPGGARNGDPARLWVAPGADGKWKLAANGHAADGKSFQVELRHDLAWRDEFYASAALQTPAEEKDAAAMDWAGLFTPLDNNGPQAGNDDSSSASAWAQVDRKLALAATDGRELAQASGGAVVLANFHGADQLTVDGGELQFGLALDEAANKLAMAGAIRFKLGSDAGIDLEGLPKSTDLSGLTGTLAGRAYAFGSESGERVGAAAEYFDQRGLGTRIEGGAGNLVAAAAGERILCSLKKPANAAGKRKVGFWFADLPLHIEDGKRMVDGNHLEGYRWAVSCGEPIAGRNLILIAGQVYFEPRVFKRFEGSAGSYSLRIGGCFVLVREGDPHEQRLSESDAGSLHDLVIAGDGGENWRWTIEPGEGTRAKVVLPLERFGADGGPPALLQLTWTPFGQTFADDATLHFDLFGRLAEVGLKKPAESMTFAYSRTAPASGQYLNLTKAEVDLSGGDPTPKLTWSARFGGQASGGNAGVAVSAEITDRRYRRDLPASRHLTVEVGGAAGTHKIELGQGGDDFLEDGHIALDWSNRPAGKATDPIPRLLGFQVGTNSGAALGLIRGTGTGADFAFDDYRLAFEVELERDRDTPAGHELRLSARAVKGTAPAIVLNGFTTLWNCALNPAIGEHSAAFHFRASAVDAANRVAAQVIHSITRNGETVTFPAAQFVRCGQRPGDNALELASDVAFVAVGAAGQSNLVLLPGRYSDQRQAGQVSPAVWTMPAPPDAMRREAARRLDEALGRSGPGHAGWLDQLLTGTDAVAGRTDDVPRTRADTSEFLELAKGGAKYFVFRPPLDWPDFVSTSAYAAILEQLARVMENLLVEVPAAPVGADTPPIYALYGPDVHHAKIIALASGPSPHVANEPDPDRLAKWERKLLDAHGPWAGIALLERNPKGKKGLLYSLVEGANADRISYERLDDTWANHAPPPCDPHRSPMPEAGLEATFAYLPAGMEGIDLTYTGEQAGLDWNLEPVLAAHALQRTWRAISLGPARQPGRYAAERDFWIGDRQAVAFRPEQDWSAAAGRNRLTPKWAPETLAAAGGAVLTATRLLVGDVAAKAEFVQYYAPASLILRDVAPRPGVWNRRRLGIAARPTIEDAADRNSRLFPIHAPELPFHARTPRPPLLGRNDWLRASEFEPVDYVASRQPQFILYGRRRLAPQVPQPHNALTREPLAAGAWKGVVNSPANGIMRPDWNDKAEIEIELAQLAGPTSAIALLDARANVAGIAVALSTGAQAGDKYVIDGSPLLKIVTDLSRPMRALIECRFELVGQDARSIERRVGFELLLMPGRQHVQQEPRFLRFEDPTYNETLILPAKFGVGNPAVGLVADRENLRPTDVFTVGLQSPSQDVKVNVWAYRNLAGPDGTNRSVEFELDFDEAFGSGFRMIDCAGLKQKEPRPEGAAEFGSLRVGDRLEIAATPAGADASRLIFDVVDEPLLPANPAGIVLLELDRDNKKMSAPLAALSPVPLMIDLVDPDDLFSGIARFRAQYGTIRYASPGADAGKGYFIQKLAGDGGTFIPGDLKRWQGSPDADPPAPAVPIR